VQNWLIPSPGGHGLGMRLD